MTLLAVTTLVAAQDPYVIDSVCVGADRDYRIDGESILDTYEWFITDTFGVTITSPSYIDFEVVNSLGDTTWGSEINYTWNDVGEFEILTLHYSEHGCDTFELGRVKVYEAPGVNAGVDQVVCSNEAIILSGDTAWNYSTILWETRGDGTFNFDDQLHPTYNQGTNDSIAGNVTLILTANGLAENGTCTPAIDSVFIQFSDPELSLISTDILCYNDSSGMIKVNVTGANPPYNFDWTGPDGYTASGDSIYGLASGKYIVTLIDAVGCTATDSVEITEPPELLAIIDSVKHVTCYGGSDGLAIVEVSGGTQPYSYLWNTPSADTDSIANGLPAGIYVVTVTDQNGCIKTDTIEITEPDELLVLSDSVKNVTCFGGNDGEAYVFVTGGTGDYTYEWNTTPIQDSSVAIDLFAGDYIVTITDEHGCEIKDTVTVTEPPAIVLSADSIDSKCGGEIPGLIDLTVSGGTPFTNEPYYLYEWHDTTGIIATTEDIDNLVGDKLYWVYVTDSLGCVDSLEMYINEEAKIRIKLEAIDSILCYGDSTGMIDISVQRGRPPYSYLWYQDGVVIDSVNQDLINIPAGFYRVVVNDRDGCDEEMSFTLKNPDELLASITPDSTEICEDDNIQFNGNPTGGTGAFTHLWTGDGATYLNEKDSVDPFFAGAPDGVYTLIYSVWDENGCFADDTTIITVYPNTYNTFDTTICEGRNRPRRPGCLSRAHHSPFRSHAGRRRCRW